MTTYACRKPRQRQKPNRWEAVWGIKPDKLCRSEWHSELSCGISRFEYDFASCTARLYLRPGQNCGMGGAIRMAERLDDRCERIETFAGGEPDTFYVWVDGGWRAFPPQVSGGVQ